MLKKKKGALVVKFAAGYYNETVKGYNYEI